MCEQKYQPFFQMDFDFFLYLLNAKIWSTRQKHNLFLRIVFDGRITNHT